MWFEFQNKTTQYNGAHASASPGGRAYMTTGNRPASGAPLRVCVGCVSGREQGRMSLLSDIPKFGSKRARYAPSNDDDDDRLLRLLRLLHHSCWSLSYCLRPTLRDGGAARAHWRAPVRGAAQ